MQQEIISKTIFLFLKKRLRYNRAVKENKGKESGGQQGTEKMILLNGNCVTIRGKNEIGDN